MYWLKSKDDVLFNLDHIDVIQTSEDDPCEIEGYITDEDADEPYIFGNYATPQRAQQVLEKLMIWLSNEGFGEKVWSMPEE